MQKLESLRFLVVDDMLTMRKIVSHQLKSLGITQIVEANDGSTAWEALERATQSNEPVQFIVSDWNMPILPGIDLLRKCRASPAYKDVAFLLLTAESEVAQVKEALLAGVDNYLVKPFTPAALSEKLNAIHRKRFST